MGLRLEGEVPAGAGTGAAVRAGLPGGGAGDGDGQGIILGVDGQTIGGYPKIAQVIRA